LNAINPTPEEAENMKVRSQLVIALNQLIERPGLNTHKNSGIFQDQR